ncbi:hypothetical protein AcV5_008590 [Taiwanofungus camphoratus]|nr:hypothetical protein AcV5_008590 [Antrodia cinnamomea]
MTSTAASTSSISSPQVVPSNSSDRNIKRKLEDAIQSLDEVVSPSVSLPDQPPPTKRLRTGRSLYSTLAKYGIRKEPKPIPSTNDFDNLSKTAPHLAAILSRSASRARKALPFKLGQMPSTPNLAASRSTSEYRPSSMQSFLSRLGTFKLTTYANKPPAIDAVAAAKCGWINNGKDRLVCGMCDISWVVGGREGMSRDAANTLIEKQRASLVDMHKDGCPWKTRQCDQSIYRIPLQTPLAMSREIKSRAVALDAVLEGVEIKHPLTSPQVQSLLSTISSVILPTFASPDANQTQSPNEVPNPIPSITPAQPNPSETAVITSLFGWAIVLPAPPAERARTSSAPSISRANSVAPSTPTRAVRSPSVAPLRDSTPIPSTLSSPLTFRSTVSTSPSRAVGQVKPDATLLHCSLCQRRVGLWAFIATSQSNGKAPAMETRLPQANGTRSQSRRQLDVLREHRSYCPYVVRSTVLPSMPVPSPAHARSESAASLMSPSITLFGDTSGAVEGWRALLTVVLRHGIARRQRLGLNRVPNGRRVSHDAEDEGASGRAQESPVEVDPVEAMVTGVKTRGGKELLKYVKGLLG